MRFLGFLFVLVLVFAVVGYFRGWFSITTAHAGSRSEVQLEVDHDRIRDDARAADAKLGQLSAKAAAAVAALGHTVSADESDLEGELTGVDQAARDLTLKSGDQTFDLHVPTGVPLTRDGETVGFDQLRATTRVRLTFKQADADRSLTRIEILH